MTHPSPGEGYWNEVTQLSATILASGAPVGWGNRFLGMGGMQARWKSPNAQIVALGEYIPRGLARLVYGASHHDLDLLNSTPGADKDYETWRDTRLRFYTRLGRGILSVSTELCRVVDGVITQRSTVVEAHDNAQLIRPTEADYQLLVEELRRGAEGESRY